MSDFNTIMSAFTDFLNTHPLNPRFQAPSGSQSPSGNDSPINVDQLVAMNSGDGIAGQAGANSSQSPRAGGQYTGMPGLNQPSSSADSGSSDHSFQFRPPRSPWLPDDTNPWIPRGGPTPNLDFPPNSADSTATPAPPPSLNSTKSSQFVDQARASLQRANALMSPTVASRPTDTQLLLAMLPTMLGQKPSYLGRMITGYQHGQSQELDRQNADLARQYQAHMNDYHQNMADAQSAHQDELAQFDADSQNWQPTKPVDAGPSPIQTMPPTRKQSLMSAFPILSDNEGSQFADQTKNLSDRDALALTGQHLTQRSLRNQIGYGTPEQSGAALAALNNSIQAERGLLLTQRGNILGKYANRSNGGVNRDQMTPEDGARLADVGTKLDELANSSVAAM